MSLDERTKPVMLDSRASHSVIGSRLVRPDLRAVGPVLYATDMARIEVKPLPLQPGSLESYNPRLARRHDYWIGDYWIGKCGARPLPSHADTDPLEMREWLGDLLPAEGRL